MLLTSLSCLLSNSSLNGSAVSKDASLEGFNVSREVCNCSFSYSLCKSLELSILRNEVSLTSKGYHDGLATVYLSDHSTF